MDFTLKIFCEQNFELGLNGLDSLHGARAAVKGGYSSLHWDELRAHTTRCAPLLYLCQ